MSDEELIKWLSGIYNTIATIEVKNTPNGIKNLSSIYYEIERVIGVINIRINGNANNEE